jgi:putative aldouronate transport system substrate-binding protein
MKRFFICLIAATLAAAVWAGSQPERAATGPSEITVWMELHQNFSQIFKNMGDTEFAKELQKRTNTKVTYLHPPAGQAREAFNLLLASGDLPDVVEFNWYTIPGGPAKAIADGYILKLNDVIDKYAPNLKAYLAAKPAIARMIKTDEGWYYSFPFLRGEEDSSPLLFTSGIIVRKDWLDDLKLPMPEVIGDWETTLKAFKDKKGATAPLSLIYVSSTSWELTNQLVNCFAPAFDANGQYYVDGGKVKLGIVQPGFKSFLAEMNGWYKQGLLDPNFATADRKAVEANFTGGKSGVTQGSAGQNIGRYMQVMTAKDPKVSVTGAPVPGPRRGELAKFYTRKSIYGDGNTGAISAKSKNVAAAARYLDYAYGKDGMLLFNFGIEGKSYTMVNGVPTYTDWVMHNPDKLAPTLAMSHYLRGHTNGPFVQMLGYLQQYYELPEQKAANSNWTRHRQPEFNLPPVTPTVDESSQLAKTMTDIRTYADEMQIKFVMGTEPITKFDEYVAQINRLGLDKTLAIWQAALERYNKRK